MRSTFKNFLLFALAVAAFAVFSQSTVAQYATPVAPRPATQTQAPSPPEKAKPRKTVARATTRQARVTMVKDQEPVAPQVVTIVHRLSGVKLLRFLLRESGEPGTVATIDPEAVKSDAHASIIAGWALEDGKTIAARLPQAAAEMEVQRFSLFQSDKDKSDKSDKSDGSADAALRHLPRAPRMQPDLTVMTQDGKTFRARYVGIDGLTGLSVLQLTEPATTAITEVAAKKITEGQNVKLFAPERVSAEATPYNILVRIGRTDAKIAKTVRARPQWVERVTLHAAKLSPNVIGGVACDESGKTLGIVDAIEGNDARLLTAESVLAATRRVLERQASVPRPLLGIRGEAVDLAARKALIDFGWDEEQFEKLIEKQVGILLTSVLPGTPAALAKLHPGDVIVRVDDKEVKSAEEFSAMLTKAGTGEEVRFTVQRPKASAPVSMDVTLGGAFQPVFEWQFEMPVVPRLPGGLKTFGVEAVALSSKSAPQWGGFGLLVVAIEPESAAARSGLKEGDVIESIDGRPVGRGAWTFAFQFNRKEKHVLSVVRERAKRQVVIEPVE
jgi:S1-C subfamily serine protease